MLGRILFNLRDLFADLNKAEIENHENLEEWLEIWKKEVIKAIEGAIINDSPDD